ncbi:hypothetical protein ACN9MY_16505 [Pseudoduganella sp. R-31]|uniref:hypothetical protein n=1 Tax=Pseudoduganella sp. R-31 TaxID=3404060 RepID=UPI003CFB1ECB
MTEQQDDSEKPQPPPAQDAGAEPPVRPGRSSRARLLEWQGPVFWMSCGALLAGLAGGAVVLAQRVGIERDLMAVATTLAPDGGRAQAAPGPQAVARAPALAEPGMQGASRQGGSALEGSSVTEPAASKPVAAPRHRARPGNGATARSKHQASAKQPPRKKSALRRKLVAEPERYAEVFKRCPWPGERGAVECRRHICNGAESEGPACRPYRSKLR